MESENPCATSKKRKYEAEKKGTMNVYSCNKFSEMFTSDKDLSIHTQICQGKTVITPNNKKEMPAVQKISSPIFSSPPHKKIKDTDELDNDWDMDEDIQSILNAMKEMEFEDNLEQHVRDEERIPERL